MQSYGIIAEVPLQSWSKARDSKTEYAPRFNQFIGIVRKKNPRFVMLKNVKGASQLKNRLKALEVLEDCGYKAGRFISANDGILAIALKTNL